MGKRRDAYDGRQYDDEDMAQWRCWNCRRTFEVPLGDKPRVCPYCGASLRKSRIARLDDPRWAREL